MFWYAHMSRRAVVLAAVAVAAQIACRPPVPPPDLSPQPAELLAQVREAQQRAQRVQGEARVRIRTARGSGTVRQFAAAERPDRVHLEELDFFGNPNVVLVAAGGRFWLYDGLKKVLYRGAATPQNLARLVPFPISAEDLVAILLGTAPLPEGEVATGAEADHARMRLRLERADVVEELWVASHAAVEKLDRRIAGGAGPGSLLVEMWGFKEQGGAWFPSHVSLDSRPADVGIDLSWTQVEVNGELDPGLFAPLAPKGARIVELGGALEGS